VGSIVGNVGMNRMGAMQQKNGARVAVRSVAWAVVALLLFVVVWVGIRAFLARDELLGAVPIANEIGTTVLSGDSAVTDELTELQLRASHAAGLTSDPIWRFAEMTPFLGVNLTAFRESASVIDELASTALPPLATLAETFTLDSLQPVDGSMDLSVFQAAGPLLSDARRALDAADASAEQINTADTIPQIGSAVDQVVDLVNEATEVVGGLDTAVSLLPPMLGSGGPRSYLLLSLNNAELRATGGIPGAIAVLEVDHGRVSLGELSSAVLPLSDAEEVLYGPLLGTYMQDANYTPDFARTGALAQAMWLERTGQTVDGVVAIDPVALSYVLSATGAIDTGTGITLDAGNAADVLLSKVYAMFPVPAEQDAFFATVTERIFSAITKGDADGRSLVSALTRATGENRIHLWSALPSEQDRLRGTAVEGAVPISAEESTAYGVYFNDATGAKMDYYLDSEISIASAVCRNDRRPTFQVEVKLASDAPADAAYSLPGYVTGAGNYGVAPGNVRTNVFVYAPAGSEPYSVTIDGEEYAFVAAEHGSHSVAGITLELAPQQSSVISMKFVGVAGAAEAVELQHTPMVRDVETTLNGYLDCAEELPAPTGDEEVDQAAVHVTAPRGQQVLALGLK
jgi:hypothetical protein